MGINITPGEAPAKPSLFIKRSTLEAQDRARVKHRENEENERRRWQAEQGQAPADQEMPQAPPPQVEVDTQLLHQDIRHHYGDQPRHIEFTADIGSFDNRYADNPT